MSSGTTAGSYTTSENRRVEAPNGTRFAYRDVGSGEVPLVLLQHFRGNLDNWDPALIDALAQNRRVVAFDNTGVGASTGTTPHTIAEMARDAVTFLDALELAEVDLLGFSIGSFLAQEITLTRPALVRRVVLASAAPKGAAGMHGWAQDVIDAVGKPQTGPDGSWPCSMQHRQRASRPESNHCSASLVRAPMIVMLKRRGRRGRRNTTQCARGVSQTTRSCSVSARSTVQSSSPTATATR